MQLKRIADGMVGCRGGIKLESLQIKLTVAAEILVDRLPTMARGRNIQQQGANRKEVSTW